MLAWFDNCEYLQHPSTLAAHPTPERERERERESVCVCVREKEIESVCVRTREQARKREKESICSIHLPLLPTPFLEERERKGICF